MLYIWEFFTVGITHRLYFTVVFSYFYARNVE
jgi:hypothetical protein